MHNDFLNPMIISLPFNHVALFGVLQWDSVRMVGLLGFTGSLLHFAKSKCQSEISLILRGYQVQ